MGSGHTCACGERETGDDADIRVLLVDDQAMVRETLSELLSDEDDVTVVGECEDGSQVVVLTAEGAGARAKVLAAGAHALVPKGVRAEALLSCLRTVGCGCCPYCL